MQVDSDSIRAPKESLEFGTHALIAADADMIVVELLLPEDQALHLNDLVADPASELYKQNITSHCMMNVSCTQ